LIVLFSSCGKTVNWDEERDFFDREKGLLLYKEKPFTGTVESFHDVLYHKIKRKQEFKDGLPNGEYVEYFRTGEIEETSNYVKGLREGERIVYTKSGKTRRRENYRSDNLEGSFVEYYASYSSSKPEQIFEKGQYTNDEKTGEWLQFYSSGKLQSKMFYKNGKLDGEAIGYYENGKIKNIGRFSEGRRVGEHLTYGEDGAVTSTNLYTDN
jgi:antitoxin component YwqK of YwqJK toxin-antitoxin module